MSTTGLDVFDKTLQTTNIWLDEIMDVVGPDRGVAWHVLGAVLRTLRDRLPLGLAAHLGAQLPLLVRGTYYDQFQPGHDINESAPRTNSSHSSHLIWRYSTGERQTGDANRSLCAWPACFAGTGR